MSAVQQVLLDWAEGRRGPETCLRELARRTDRALVSGIRDVPVRAIRSALDSIDGASLSPPAARALARLLVMLPPGRFAAKVNALARSVGPRADRPTLAHLLFALHIHGTRRLAAKVVERGLASRSAWVRSNAVLAAGGLSNMPVDFPRIALTDSDSGVRGYAALALGSAPWHDALRTSLLRQMLRDPDPEVRGDALLELADILPVPEVESMVRRHSRRGTVAPAVLRDVRSLLKIRHEEERAGLAT